MISHRPTKYMHFSIESLFLDDSGCVKLQLKLLLSLNETEWLLVRETFLKALT